MGIDETRRGKPVGADPDTGKWHAGRGPVAHRVHRHSAPAGCSARSRAAPPTTSWPGWPAHPGLARQIRHVAIDMSATYRAAVRGDLPHATLVVDHFHVVQLANEMVARSADASPPSCAGRRGRKPTPSRRSDAAAAQPRRPHRREFTNLWNPLIDEGPRPDDPDGLDRQGGTPPPARPGRHRRRPPPSATPARRSTPGAPTPPSPTRTLAGTIDPGGPRSTPSSTPDTQRRQRGQQPHLNSTPATPTATATPTTNDYEHAAQPPAEPADTSAPSDKVEDPVSPGRQGPGRMEQQARDLDVINWRRHPDDHRSRTCAVAASTLAGRGRSTRPRNLQPP